LMMSLWDALRMNMMISYQELVRTFPEYSTGKAKGSFTKDNDEKVIDEAGKGLSHQSISKYQTPVYAMRASAFRSQRTLCSMSSPALCRERKLLNLP
ncbi:hypothetical protein, partial [Citrobacter portucalensis]|uniref:hypothetical protein n=1 Tax=Citrobacter portucalensis TaxID=1639133 RepID=UPI001E4AC8A8